MANSRRVAVKNKKCGSPVGIANQCQPKSTATRLTAVPPPQSARIVQRYVTGQSIRRIAREEKRDRATITKIMRSSEVAEYISKTREQFYGIGDLALESVKRALTTETDGKLAYQMLKDIGVVPNPQARSAPQSGYSREAIDQAKLAVSHGLFAMIREKARAYNMDLSELDEVGGGKFTASG